MLEEIVLENNHNICGYPLIIPVMSSKEELKCRNVKVVSCTMVSCTKSSQKPRKVCPPYIIYVLSYPK